MEIIVTTRKGEERRIPFRLNISLMEALREGGIDDILALCGGCASCATCHVHVEQSFLRELPDMSDVEDALLDTSSSRDETSRLSCQILLSQEMSGMKVRIAEED